jgi:L(+)-tartrate dehydratase alpha subunit
MQRGREAPIAIHQTVLETAMYEALRLASTRLPPDVERALRRALEEETDQLARQHLLVSLQNAEAAAAGDGLVCADTGYPLLFIRLGADTTIEGGLGTLWAAARTATARATHDNYLRPTMVNPLDRMNPGDNVGHGMPKVEIRFDGQGDALELIACPKGGGSEIFGTFYRMLYPSDGEAGILKFAIDSIREGCYAGKICPPAIIGLGIGGTADLCMKLSKEAALLRPVGSRHPDPLVAAIEDKLMAASRELGIGPMGSRGLNAVMAVHADIAYTHTAALPVAVNAQCLVARRWRAVVHPCGAVMYSGEIS